MRCWGDGDPLLADYHDREWGRPVRDERGLYERVCLEGFQAGLSWRLVLARREALREAYAGFDPDVVAGFDDAHVEALGTDARLIRNRAKLAAPVRNAHAVLGLRVTGRPLPEVVSAYRSGLRPAPPKERADVPTTSPESVGLSRELKRAGMVFVGPTTCYALMQATGLVNDHLLGCDSRQPVQDAQDAASA